MIRAIILWVLLALPSAAQSLPDWSHTSINDFAGLLSNEDTRILDQALIALNEATGVEGTVVTLDNRARYGGKSGLEPFATALFNYWGVGDKQKNDGFMVLVLRDDREARIELGAGYPASFDRTAQRIMDEVMVPEFRDGDYSAGLRKGTLAVIDNIARPHAAGEAAPARLSAPRDRASPQDSGGGDWGLFYMFAAFFSVPVIAGIYAMWRHGRCPKCGNRDLVEIESPLREDISDSGWQVSQMKIEALCQKCGWRKPRIRSLNYTDSFDPEGVFVARRYHEVSSRSDSSSSSSSSGFGGGSSSGGGASGKW